MPRKIFRVKVELDIQAVTCPGVWLCPNGKASLQIYMLDSCAQTSSKQPIFPLLYHEKFTFEKAFVKPQRLSDLQRILNKQYMYAELIQWQNCDVGNVLATFRTSLSEFLYPSTYEGAIAGVDIDLLMEPARNFPGIIAPKIEVCTKTTIEEAVATNASLKNESCVINPKVIQSTRCAPQRGKLHQTKVCHSAGYHRSRRCVRKRSKQPPFQYRKPEEELLARKPQGLEVPRGIPAKTCRCSKKMIIDKKFENASGLASERTYTALTEEFLNKYPPVKPKCLQKARRPTGASTCLCGNRNSCPICAKYKYYFDDPLLSTSHKTKNDDRKQIRGCRRSPVRKCDCISPERKAESKPCYCSPVLHIQNYLRNSRICDCSLNSDNGKSERETRRVCICPPQKKPSLAEKLHQRLEQTLKTTTCYPFEGCNKQISDEYDLQQSPVCEPCRAPTSCPCPNIDYKNCREEFYDNLEKFYKRLYKRAHSKARSEKQICCN